jgi:Do/DeqQ family serine protease
MPRAVLGIAFALVASLAALLGLLAGGGGAPGTRLPSARAAPSPSSFADVVERVNPGVVSIVVRPARAERAEETEVPDFGEPRRGEGSGFVVDPRGYILTNHHVVPGGARIRVRLADKRELAAALVGSDPSTDLALLKVDAQELPTVPLGDSDRLRVGEWVAAIGNPYRFDHSVTVGVVSSKGRKIWDASFDAYIQTDAAINPGNSGGPLINEAGEAVGISSAVSREGQGIGFAVPINVARGILEQLRTRGRVSRGYLGIQLQELDPDLRRMLGYDRPGGALVLDVVKDGAGEEAGVERYDVVMRIGGEPVADGDELVREISRRAPGSRVSLDVFRGGRELALSAQLVERRSPQVARREEGPQGEQPAAGDALGLDVVELSAKLRGDMAIAEDRLGVVVREVASPATGGDALRHGDIIVEVNRRPTPDKAAYQRALGGLAPGQPAFVLAYRPRSASLFLAKLEVEQAR